MLQNKAMNWLGCFYARLSLFLPIGVKIPRFCYLRLTLCRPLLFSFILLYVSQYVVVVLVRRKLPLILRSGTTWTGDLKCRALKTGYAERDKRKPVLIDSHWLEISKNLLCPSMGPNGGSVMETARKARVAPIVVLYNVHVQCLNNRSQGQSLSSTPGQAKLFARFSSMVDKFLKKHVDNM